MSGEACCTTCGHDMWLPCWSCEEYADFKQATRGYYDRGAAVAFGILGMAEAIRLREIGEPLRFKFRPGDFDFGPGEEP